MIRRSHLFPRLVSILVTALWATTATAAGPATWTQWGGPGRDFKIKDATIADTWPDTGPRQLWRRALPDGYSSIVADGGRLFTMYRDGEQDVIIALDAASGKTLFERRYAAPTHDGQVLNFGKGPNATPLILGDRLVTIGFTGKMNCVSTSDGRVLWAHDLIQELGGKVQKFGYSASPMLYKGNIIALVGGKTGIVAFAPQDGRVVWQSDALDISYASPLLINVDGQDQIAFFSSTEILGVDAANGRKEWSWPCKNQYENNCSPPMWGPNNMLWATTQQDGGTRMLQLSRAGGKTQVKELWSSSKIRCFHWNAIWDQDTIYATIGDTTTPLAAIEAKTGKVLWRKRGFSKAKLLYAGDNLILLDEEGRLGLAKVSPQKADIRASIQLLEKVAWTPPTLVGNTLYVRDNTQIMALDLSATRPVN